jgi:hypothetical protein
MCSHENSGWILTVTNAALFFDAVHTRGHSDASFVPPTLASLP